ncbi:MAG TPA: ATP-binding protein [Polyangia bacterium]|nr:ATP-binding protein [Polyangia bacterium]
MAAIVVGFLLVTLVAGDLFVRRQKRSLHKDALALAAAVSDFRTSQISRWLAERRGDALVASRDPVIARAVVEAADPGARDAGLRRLGLIAASYGYKAMIAVDRQGARRISVGADTALDAETPALVADARRTGRVLFSTFRRATDGSGGLTFDIIVPLLSDAGPGPDARQATPALGALVLRFDPTRALVEFLSVEKVSGRFIGGELMMLARNGARDLYIYPRQLQLGQAWLLDGPRDPQSAEALVAAGRTDFAEATDAHGRPLLAASSPLPETSAVIVTSVRTTELMGDVLRASWMMIGLLAAALLSVAVFVLNRANVRARRALGASREKFQAIFETMQDGYILSDAGGTVTLVNPAAVRMLGYPSEAGLLGKNMERDVFADPEDRIALKAKLAASGETSAHKATFRRADGGQLIVEGNVRLLRDAGGAFAGIEGVLRDMTAHYRNRAELIEAREAAMAATRAKSEFCANMSHEIRTPLNAIVGLGHLLQRSELPDQQRDYVNKIQASSQMLLQSVNNVLDVSKIEARKLELEQTRFDLVSVLDSVADVLVVAARDKGLQLSLRVADGVPGQVMGDPLRLRQVVTNLVGNAIKFTDRGEVVLGVEPAGDTAPLGVARLRFSVRDTGIGIAPEHIEKIFEPFTQADGSTTRRFGGTGLGLTICRQLVEMMGGQLVVESASGVGSTFSFVIPFDVPATVSALGAGAGSATGPARAAPAGLRGRRVLVAEDNAVNQEVARELLEAAGITVVIADNGRQAVEAATGAGARFDAVLMDMQMPEMDGLEATRIIRGHPIAARVPIIAMTAHALASERDRCFAGGMNDHVQKPVEPDTLYEALLRWVKPGEAMGDLPGIDVASALARLGGDRVVYHRLLANLLREWEDATGSLETALAVPDLPAIRRTAHALKGASATLGVQPLASEAAALEQAAGEGEDGAAVAAAVARTRGRLAGVLAVLRPRLPARPRPEPGPGGEDALEATLAELGDLLGRRNLRARETLARLRRIVLPARCHASLERVAIDVDRLDYASAGRALEDLKASLRPETEAAS